MHLLQKLEQRRQEIVTDRTVRKKGFLGGDNLRKVIPGSYPQNTKKGGMRPLVLSACREAKKQYLHLYFSIVSEFKAAAKRYRKDVLISNFHKELFVLQGCAYIVVDQSNDLFTFLRTLAI